MTLAEGDPDLEEKLRRMGIYDFYFRIFTLKKNAARAVNKFDDDTSFGTK